MYYYNRITTIRASSNSAVNDSESSSIRHKRKKLMQTYFEVLYFASSLAFANHFLIIVPDSLADVLHTAREQSKTKQIV